MLGALGSGRTTLCETWLHQNQERFDRSYQVRVGHRAGADVLAELLAKLGYGLDEMPASLEARRAMWQSRTAEFKVALLIDDALSAAEVTALLPTHPGSYVLVVGSGLEVLRARYYVRDVELKPLSNSTRWWNSCACTVNASPRCGRVRRQRSREATAIRRRRTRKMRWTSLSGTISRPRLLIC
ncbi:hypothetical protein [Amycolatopsis orientalis]|uniref:hypothetical protein n=1 Tax=Amycolatopsis orientalis TaxID=31958 RepID=UPI000565F21C|nr:hypothetical protein [Amycolatopsis orientalis]